MNDKDQASRLSILIGVFSGVRYTVLMINLILLTLSLATPAPVQTAQFRPCVWPNTCRTAAAPAIEVAQFTSCVWPNKCAEKPALITL